MDTKRCSNRIPPPRDNYGNIRVFLFQLPLPPTHTLVRVSNTILISTVTTQYLKNVLSYHRFSPAEGGRFGTFRRFTRSSSSLPQHLPSRAPGLLAVLTAVVRRRRSEWHQSRARTWGCAAVHSGVQTPAAVTTAWRREISPCLTRVSSLLP